MPMEQSSCKIISFVPMRKQQRDERIYKEAKVKEIVSGAVRDVEIERNLKPWSAKKLHEYVESVFDFD